jgi:hypothetical protein
MPKQDGFPRVTSSNVIPAFMPSVCWRSAFVARPLGACEERWVGSDWMIRNVLGHIAAILMIGAASAASASDA